MADYLDVFPSRFLKASDIDKAYDATITDVEMENVGTTEKPEQKLVASFEEEGRKPIVLNKTRCESLEEITGTRDYTTWSGRRINVSKGSTRYAGKKAACIVLSAPTNDIPF